MKLEDTIKQTKPFKNEFQKLILNISVTSSWFNGMLAEKLKPYDISPHQFNVLRILKGNSPEGYCNQQITERMIDKSSNATRIVDKLVLKNFVDRTQDPKDRRHVDIRINKKGLELLDKIDTDLETLNKQFKDFNKEKAKIMNEWLDELRS